MNFRQLFNDKPGAAIGAAAGLLLVALVFLYLQMRSPAVPGAQSKAYYTVDDGKTWFADDATKLAPFEKDGKQAVRAYVYRSSKGQEFVNYLERFKPDARAALEASRNNKPESRNPAGFAAVQSAYTAGREVKRPGDAKWVGAGDFRNAAGVVSVKPPDGSPDATPLDP